MSFINVNGIKLFYRTIKNGVEVEETDQDFPTLIVLHGGPGIVDHQIEFDAWKIFADDHSAQQVIFIDQRGSGRSDDGEPENWNLEQCGKDIKVFCDQLNIKNPIIAGVSWGGYVAMSYAIQFPYHPAGLILTNTEAKVDLDAKMDAYKNAIEKLDITENNPPYNELGENQDKIAEKVGEIACNYDKEPTPSNFDLFVKFCVPLFSRNKFDLTPPSRVNMQIREKFIGEESLQMNFIDQLHTVSCPVLQLAGERDPTHPAICARRTAEKFPHATYIEFDAGAPVYCDQQQQFTQAVNEHLSMTWQQLKKKTEVNIEETDQPEPSTIGLSF